MKKMKKIIAFLMAFMMLPAVVLADDTTTYYNLDSGESIASAFGENSDAVLGNGFKNSGALMKITPGQSKSVTVSDLKIGQNTAYIDQMVKFSGSGSGEITIKEAAKASIRIGISNKNVYVYSPDGWISVARYTENTWFNISVRTELSRGTFSVYVDGMQLSSSYWTELSKADSITYSVRGNSDSEFSLDELYIDSKAELRKGTASSGTSSGVPETRGFPEYEVPENGIAVSGLYGEEVITASSELTEEGRTADKILDNNPQTYWQAGVPEEPEDKGQSLMISKESQGNPVIVTYSFNPQTELIVLEQDILTTESVSEKALPYFYSSDGGIALTTVFTDSRLVATGSTLVNEIKTDTWYHLKYVMNIRSKKCDIYLDGVLKLQDKDFREEVGDISKIRYHISNDRTGTMYIDNVKLWVGSEDSEPILNEDFESYQEGSSKLDGWGSSNGGGNFSVEKFRLKEGPKYPQRVVLDMGRIGNLEQAEIVFPQGHSYKFDVEISRNGRAFNHIAQYTDRYYGGTMDLTFAPVSTRYIRITLLDGQNGVPAAISEFNVWWQKKTPEENLAFTADLTSSSELDSEHDVRGINDNEIAKFARFGEWRPSAEDTTPWVQLNWNEPQNIDRIVLHDSAILEENIKKGTLTFSDGTSMEVTDIPQSGMPLILDFEPKTVSWVKFTINEFEGAAALSEIQVYPVGNHPELIEYVEPWKVVTINEDYASKWLLAADVDNDGEAELVSCRSQYNQYNMDNHEVRTACAMELDGSLIWSWGTAGEGVTTMGADSPCQVHDIDNDGVMEVLLCTREELVILNAQNGKEEKRYPLPVGQSHPDQWATDCIIIANITGGDYPSDIIVKSRYHEAWAYTKDWKLLWHVSMPGGMKIGHQPHPVDIDNDGYDEVLVGYSLVKPDGSYGWIMNKDEYLSDLDASHSHCDSVKLLNYYVVGDVDENGVLNKNDAVLLESLIGKEATEYQLKAGDTDADGVLSSSDLALLNQRLNNEIKSFPNKGAKPEDIRICLCLCGSCDIVMIDGNGKRVWAEEDGMHYETILTGKMIAGSDETQIISNPNFPQWMNSESGNQPMFIHDVEGNLIKAQFGFEWNRKPSIINWSGNEDYLFMPADGFLFDINMNIKARLLAPFRGHDSAMAYNINRGDTAYRLDFNGDGRQDLANLTDASGKVELYIYLNENGKIVADGIGSGYNVTFY